MVALEGKVLTWFQWWETRAEDQSWWDFKNALSRRFQPALAQNLFEVLLGLKQEGTVSEYRDTFEEISCPLKIGNTNYLKGNFMNGLKEESRVELRLHPLKTLEKLIDLALLIEPTT